MFFSVWCLLCQFQKLSKQLVFDETQTEMHPVTKWFQQECYTCTALHSNIYIASRNNSLKSALNLDNSEAPGQFSLKCVYVSLYFCELFYFAQASKQKCLNTSPSGRTLLAQHLPLGLKQLLETHFPGKFDTNPAKRSGRSNLKIQDDEDFDEDAPQSDGGKVAEEPGHAEQGNFDWVICLFQTTMHLGTASVIVYGWKGLCDEINITVTVVGVLLCCYG